MEKIVGQVTEEEKNNMIDICEKKVALDNLERITAKDKQSLIEDIKKERNIANIQYDTWWDNIRENYDFEGDEKGYWQLDFRTGEVLLVT